MLSELPPSGPSSPNLNVRRIRHIRCRIMHFPPGVVATLGVDLTATPDRNNVHNRVLSLDAAHRVTGLSWAIEVNHQVTNERVVHIEPNSERRCCCPVAHQWKKKPHREWSQVDLPGPLQRSGDLLIGLRKLLCGLFADSSPSPVSSSPSGGTSESFTTRL